MHILIAILAGIISFILGFFLSASLTMAKKGDSQ